MDFIVYNGQKYYWDGRYYTPVGGCVNGRKRLHCAVWEKHNGPIPEGFHVHHKDGNKRNNDISNLECLSKEEHLKHHGAKMSEEQKQLNRNQLDKVRHLAAEWHRSEVGRAWHKEHGKRTWEHRGADFQHVCASCGKSFKTRTNRAKYCSNPCKSAYRRRAGLDATTETCPVCGKSFNKNKYLPQKTCSKTCGRRYSREKAASL